MSGDIVSDRTISIALDRYDRHVPFFLGEVAAPPGITYRALEVGMVPPRRHGIDRHGRMLRNLEFDAAEVSLASYILARQRGAPLTAVPVFPRRLFSQNHIFVNVDAKIREPRDLIGKRVGIWAFQVTMSVLAKADLQDDYGVAWREVRWVTQHPEEIDWSGQGLPVERAPEGADLAQMLVDGEIDAFIHPHPPHLVQERTDRVRRLFADPRAESTRYFGRRGYFPIMHLLALRTDVAEELPHLPVALLGAWEDAKRQAQDFYHDPGCALLAFARNDYEAEQSELGADIWPSGLSANRRDLDRFIGAVDQRLLDSPVSSASLFHRSVLDT